jgi:S-adenosylmethionine:tRNA ribosyltransferase-isomerase
MEGGVVIAASAPRSPPERERLLHIDSKSGRIDDALVRDLPGLLRWGDVLVVNDASTMPASFRTPSGDLELRLLTRLSSDDEWQAVLFGAGDFRTPTEDRPAPPPAPMGSTLNFGAALSATVTRVDVESPRIVNVRFHATGMDLWQAFYRHGRLVQYAYVPTPLSLWDVQSCFAARPWALEMPSAGRPLTWRLITELRHRGIDVVSVTHAAGLSSTGSALLDRRLPAPERYEISEAARAAVERAKASGGRVIAVGTTVVRALEASALAHGGVLTAGVDEARLVIGPGYRPRIVDGVLSGMHPRGTSHFALLTAFAPPSTLTRALEHAELAGYLEHEFGDSCLVIGSKG